ncbi:hypothetical protein [Streptomyces sp. NBC_00847]|uniref:hypothetical protein n=1 Tax=Streptomyces sp. NBC_00847 TaxID=2975850 RepID=UPI0022535CDE|nr:hypothetical protein [Streptomyces sp. NBC_00847]MCX4879286.1 hypothetical protein [Streptomyces sp. NBC_00847]
MTLTIGPLRAEPGQKTRGSLPADLGPTTAEVPLILVNGSRPGPRIVITGGVHGGEFIPPSTPPPAWPDCWNRTRSPASW